MIPLTLILRYGKYSSIKPVRSAGSQPLELFFSILISVGGILAYVLPTIIATRLKHPWAFTIGVLNVLLGWTLIVWFGLLLWSINSDYFLDMTSKPGRTEAPRSS